MPGLRVLLGSATPGAGQGGAKEQKAGCKPSPVSFIDSLICWTSVLFGRAECYSDIRSLLCYKSETTGSTNC